MNDENQHRWAIVKRTATAGSVQLVNVCQGRAYSHRDNALRGLDELRQEWETNCRKGYYLRSLAGQFDQHHWLIEVQAGQRIAEAVNLIPGLRHKETRRK